MLVRRSGTEVAVVGDDVDLVELPDLVEHLLRGGHVERGERGTREVVRLAEPEDARDRELLRRPLEQDRDGVADGEIELLGRRRVDADVRRAGTAAPLRGARAAMWDRRSSSRRASEDRHRPIASPVAGSIICAYPVTVPDASATPGTACTVARTSSGTGLRSSPPPPPGPS